jgi:hypothetical protein
MHLLAHFVYVHAVHCHRAFKVVLPYESEAWAQAHASGFRRKNAKWLFFYIVRSFPGGIPQTLGGCTIAHLLGGLINTVGQRIRSIA